MLRPLVILLLLAFSSAARTAPVPPPAASPPPEPEVGPVYAIVPVRTDLQRRLIGGPNADKRLAVLVLVRGDAFFVEPKLLNAEVLAPQALRQLLIKYNARSERAVHFAIHYRGAGAGNSQEGMDFVSFGVEGIGRWAGFGISTSSNTFNELAEGRKNWDDLTAPLKAADGADADEPQAGTGAARTYSVRTSLSRLLVAPGTEAVVEVLTPLDPAQASWLTAKERKEVGDAISALKLPAGSKTAFHFKLKSRDGKTDERVNGLAYELAQPHGLQVGSINTR